MKTSGNGLQKLKLKELNQDKGLRNRESVNESTERRRERETRGYSASGFL